MRVFGACMFVGVCVCEYVCVRESLQPIDVCCCFVCFNPLKCECACVSQCMCMDMNERMCVAVSCVNVCRLCVLRV